MEKQRKGFACMSPEKRKEIARLGGIALHKKRGSNYMAKIGFAGGKSVSADREYMSTIGRIGGLIISKDREHMKAIASKGGKNKRKK